MLKKSITLFTNLKLLLIPLILLLATSCSEKKVIVNNLDEREANEILVFLSTKNIDAQKTAKIETGAKSGGMTMWNIIVKSSDSTKAMAILNVNGLPRRQGANLLDIFAGGGLVSSEQEQKIRYQSGLDAQIANTIRKFDGVLDADVLISYPQEDELSIVTSTESIKKQVTASVYIKHSGILDDPNSYLIPQIKRLVASSVNGLLFDNVTIIPDKSRFADFALQTLNQDNKEHELVAIWTISLAKTSILRFRIIFFSLLSLLLLSSLTAGWLLFKVSPLFSSAKGMDLLKAPHPLNFSHLGIKTEPKPKAKTEDEKKETEENSSETKKQRR